MRASYPRPLFVATAGKASHRRVQYLLVITVISLRDQYTRLRNEYLTRALARNIVAGNSKSCDYLRGADGNASALLPSCGSACRAKRCRSGSLSDHLSVWSTVSVSGSSSSRSSASALCALATSTERQVCAANAALTRSQTHRARQRLGLTQPCMIDQMVERSNWRAAGSDKCCWCHLIR